jgi:hypothetical protein
MTKLAAARPQGEWDEQVPAPAPDPDASRMMARVRLMMIVSGLTTLVAIAAVTGVIAYRVYHSGGAAAPAESIVVLPKGARVVATSVTDERIAVTLEIGGATEIRTFDARTLKETGRIKFATEP